MKRLPKSRSKVPSIAGYLFVAMTKHFEPRAHPKVLDFLKSTFTDLAHHYHSLYRDPEQFKEKAENFREALDWYEEILVSFPNDATSSAINYQLADLLLENHSFARAALEYEKVAYSYPSHPRSSAAGYAAIYGYRENIRNAEPGQKDKVRRNCVRSSLRFVETFPKHEKAPMVLGAAADDLYDMKDHEQALAAARKLIAVYPDADRELLNAAWIVIGHSCYDLKRYSESEAAYVKVLVLLPPEDKRRGRFTDNLADSIYRQGEQGRELKRASLLCPLPEIVPLEGETTKQRAAEPLCTDGGRA